MRLRKPWYLKKVRPKVNKTWTDSEKLNVFLSSQDRPSSEVADLFGITLHQVYNTNRLVKKGLKKRCYICGGPLNKAELGASQGLIKACTKCKKASTTYKRGLRKRALKKGLCGYCQEKPVISGQTACVSCVSATHRRRYNQGLCGTCGKRPISKNHIALCEVCAHEFKMKARLKRITHANA